MTDDTFKRATRWLQVIAGVFVGALAAGGLSYASGAIVPATAARVEVATPAPALTVPPLPTSSATPSPAPVPAPPKVTKPKAQQPATQRPHPPLVLPTQVPVTIEPSPPTYDPTETSPAPQSSHSDPQTGRRGRGEPIDAQDYGQGPEAQEQPSAICVAGLLCGQQNP